MLESRFEELNPSFRHLETRFEEHKSMLDTRFSEMQSLSRLEARLEEHGQMLETRFADHTSMLDARLEDLPMAGLGKEVRISWSKLCKRSRGFLVRDEQKSRFFRFYPRADLLTCWWLVGK